MMDLARKYSEPQKKYDGPQQIFNGPQKKYSEPQKKYYGPRASASYAAIIFTFYIILKCATSRVKSEIPAAKTFGSLHVFGGPVGFLGGAVDFLIHWPPGPVVATVQCQGLYMLL